VLGHDLRNPLASIDAGTKLLMKNSRDTRDENILRLIQSSASRMSELIDNVLDFARGRMGSGLQLALTAEAPLEPVLHQILAELHTSWSDRLIQTHFALSEAIYCDRGRIGQMLSNLVGNALTYGSADKPITVWASTNDGIFELSVTNGGDRIPDAALERLFQPFSRGTVQADKQGLGLGLYIASEVARAHGGTLEVQSTEAETRFTFRMPTKPN
jgi:sigma-B regulation protein RsbU (phosphoserine phosphatase)